MIFIAGFVSGFGSAAVFGYLESRRAARKIREYSEEFVRIMGEIERQATE